MIKDVAHPSAPTNLGLSSPQLVAEAQSTGGTQIEKRIGAGTSSRS